MFNCLWELFHNIIRPPHDYPLSRPARIDRTKDRAQTRHFIPSFADYISKHFWAEPLIANSLRPRSRVALCYIKPTPRQSNVNNLGIIQLSIGTLYFSRATSRQIDLPRSPQSIVLLLQIFKLSHLPGNFASPAPAISIPQLI